MSPYTPKTTVIERLAHRVKRPMSDGLQVFWHITFLFWLPLINAYADSAGVREDVCYVLTGMSIIAGYILIRSLIMTLGGQKRMSFIESVVPIAILAGMAALVVNVGAEMIDAATANPKMAILYAVGFYIGHSSLGLGMSAGVYRSTVSVDLDLNERHPRGYDPAASEDHRRIHCVRLTDDQDASKQ